MTAGKGHTLVLGKTLHTAHAHACLAGLSCWTAGIDDSGGVGGLTIDRIIAVGLTVPEVERWMHQTRIAPIWIAAEPLTLEFVR